MGGDVELPGGESGGGSWLTINTSKNLLHLHLSQSKPTSKPLTNSEATVISSVGIGTDTAVVITSSIVVAGHLVVCTTHFHFYNNNNKKRKHKHWNN